MKQKVSTIVILLLMASFVYYVIPTPIVLHNKALANSEKQSTIAGIVVDGMSRDEMNQALQQAIQNWTSEKITIAGGGQTIALDASSIQFDIADSIDRYDMLTDKPWYAFWKKKPIAQIPVSVLITEEVSRQIAQIPQWDYKETSNNLVAQAAYLKSHEIEAVINDQVGEISQELLAAVVEPLPKEAFGIQEIIEPFVDFTLTSHTEFSFLETLDGQESFANEEALNFVASMLYSVALQANGEIIERHSQHIIPPYLEPGIEAAVEKDGRKNLRFVNTTDEAIQLQFIVQGENLKLEAYATNLIEPATIRVEREKKVEPRVIARYSKDLAFGRQRIVEQGRDGARVAVYRSHPERGEELIGKDYYAPLNKVVLKSARVPDPQPEPQAVVPTMPQNTASDFGISAPGNIGTNAPSNTINASSTTNIPAISNGIAGESGQNTVNTTPKNDTESDAAAAKQKMNKEKKFVPQ